MNFLQIFFAIIAIAPAAIVLVKRLFQDQGFPGYLEFDFYAAADITVFIGSCLLGAAVADDITYEFAYIHYCLLLFLSSIVFFLGYQSGRRAPVTTEVQRRFDPSRAVFCGFLLILISLYGYAKKDAIVEESLVGGQCTGMGVVILFICSFSYIGSTIILIALRHKKALFGVFLLAVQVVLFGIRVYDGRRSALAQLGVFFAVTSFFVFRKRIPRNAVIVSIVLMMVAIPLMGRYRETLWEKSQTELEDFYSEDTALSKNVDIYNGIYLTGAAAAEFNYEWGLRIYNNFVFLCVPGVLVGDLKSSLYAESNDQSLREYMRMEYHHELPLGTCMTGVADLFTEFSYFSILIFWLLGFSLGKLTHLVEQDRNDVLFFIYLILLPVSFRLFGDTITLHIVEFVRELLFFSPVILLVTDWRKENKNFSFSQSDTAPAEAVQKG